MSLLSGYLGTKEASKRLNVSDRMIRYYIEEEKLEGSKILGRWFVTEASVKDFIAKKAAGEIEEQAP